MKRILVSAIAVLAFFAVLALGLLVLSVSVATAEDTDSGETPIDIETDDDGNGIPDEFETEFKELMASIQDMGSSGTNLEDIQESKAYRLIRGFYERLPIKAETKQTLDEGALAFQKLAKSDSLEKQQKELDELEKKQKELVDDDPVYARAVEYIKAMAPAHIRDDTGASTGANSDAGRPAGKGDILSAQSRGRPSPLISSSDDNYENEINRVGDLIFRDSRSPSNAQTGSSGFQYAMDWTHVGLYSGDGQAYDADKGTCPAGADHEDGVALRNLSRYYRSGHDVMHSQLANQSWRWSEARALENAEEEYGTRCETPFSISIFDIDGTSSFYCSKLVWRVYKDNEQYSVDLDSNHVDYYYWIEGRYGPMWALFFLASTVAPDEVALDSDLNNYYETHIN